MMDVAVRTLVRQRAGNRCEYCRLHQDEEPYFRLHVEHIIARQHGGSDDISNLALACHHCNLHKGPNLTGIDPETGQITPLFHPRQQVWDEHFAFLATTIVGLSPTGRTTVYVLNVNAEERLNLRAELLASGEQNGHQSS